MVEVLLVFVTILRSERSRMLSMDPDVNIRVESPVTKVLNISDRWAHSSAIASRVEISNKDASANLLVWHRDNCRKVDRLQL